MCTDQPRSPQFGIDHKENRRLCLHSSDCFRWNGLIMINLGKWFIVDHGKNVFAQKMNGPLALEILFLPRYFYLNCNSTTKWIWYYFKTVCYFAIFNWFCNLFDRNIPPSYGWVIKISTLRHNTWNGLAVKWQIDT